MISVCLKSVQINTQSRILLGAVHIVFGCAFMYDWDKNQAI